MISDPLADYEVANQALLEGYDTLENRKAAVLALAKAGALEFAQDRLKAFNLLSVDNDEDALALHGRLLKDQALLLKGDARRTKLEESASAYMRAFELTGGTYSGVNAATLFCMAGHSGRGMTIAADVSEKLKAIEPSKNPIDQYYYDATLAEIALLRGNIMLAITHLDRAYKSAPDDIPAHATTLKQFARIIEARELDGAWLNDYRPPSICFFAGRISGLESGSEQETKLTDAFATLIKEKKIGSGYGALAAGSDILMAEALLASGGSLHIVLPCDPDAFEAVSVAPFGAQWVTRYRKCLEQAATCVSVTRDNSLMGGVAIKLAATMAMGQAIMSARTHATLARQVLIDPRPNSLTETLRTQWVDSGRSAMQHTIWTDTKSSLSKASPVKGLEPEQRQLGAILFADLVGFGRLDDAQVIEAVDHYLKPLAASIKAARSNPLYLNTWGDGIFAIFDDVETAAEAALRLQDTMRTLGHPDLLANSEFALRVGLHYGPLTMREDPVMKRLTPYGSQVAYAARIEPLAIPGSVLASESFVAALSLATTNHVKASYVGRRKMRSFEETVRLFALQRT